MTRSLTAASRRQSRTSPSCWRKEKKKSSASKPAAKPKKRIGDHVSNAREKREDEAATLKKAARELREAGAREKRARRIEESANPKSPDFLQQLKERRKKQAALYKADKQRQQEEPRKEDEKSANAARFSPKTKRGAEKIRGSGESAHRESGKREEERLA